MNKLILLLSAIALPVSGATERIQNIPLNENAVVTVPISGSRITTISFPSAISAIDAALITTDAKTPGLFQLSHTKGSSFLSVRALVAKAVSNINVRWNKKTYVFEIHESDDPAYSIVLHEAKKGSDSQKQPMTPARLMGLMDKAKAYPILQQQYPAEAAQIERHTWKGETALTDCDDYRVILQEGFRFKDHDTLILRVSAENKTDKPIQHAPDKLAIKAGEFTAYPALTDFPATIAPKQRVSGYLAITGIPDFTQSFSLQNDFTFILARNPKPEVTK